MYVLATQTHTFTNVNKNHILTGYDSNINQIIEEFLKRKGVSDYVIIAITSCSKVRNAGEEVMVTVAIRY